MCREKGVGRGWGRRWEKGINNGMDSSASLCRLFPKKVKRVGWEEWLRSLKPYAGVCRYSVFMYVCVMLKRARGKGRWWCGRQVCLQPLFVHALFKTAVCSVQWWW